MSYRKNSIVTAFLLLVLVGTSSGKPKLKVAADGFPVGQATPEGAASDLARAFMTRNAGAFRKVCIRPYGGQGRSEYTDYLDGVFAHLRQATGSPTPDDPKKIVTVFAARHLSKNGPASYGYASFDFQDVMFVDVEVMLQNGNKHLRRTLVIKDRDGKWYVHPVPDVTPLLSYGLYDESASVQPLTDAYDVVR
jgi:hypothetical protein